MQSPDLQIDVHVWHLQTAAAVEPIADKAPRLARGRVDKAGGPSTDWSYIGTGRPVSPSIDLLHPVRPMTALAASIPSVVVPGVNAPLC